MILTVIKNIYRKINDKAVNGVEEERMPYEEQMKYLRSFPDPKDDYERSFFKFRCFTEYCYYKRKWTLIFYNTGAMFLLPFVYKKLRKASRATNTLEPADAVIENVPRLPNVDVMPETLLDGYDRIKEIEQIDYSESCLTDTAEEIYREVKKRYFFHFYYRMIVLQKLGLFSMYLKCYRPKLIAFYSVEREFSGPLQALLCEKSGAKYVSFMHGDYLSTLSFAFQRYTTYYVWDEAYQRMFEELKCGCPMPVYRPKKLNGTAEAIDEKECRYFATYYFSDETRAEALTIHSIFSEFEKAGLKTKVRPHPRFSDIEMLHEVFSDIEIEDPKAQSIAESLTCSLYTVGLNTTVLSEAFFSGKPVVIDDLSNVEKYRHLDERGYIMIKRPHILLSELRGRTDGQYDGTYAFCCR